MRLYNKFLENLILPLGDRINNSHFIQDLKYWRNVQQMNEKELNVLQSHNLLTLLRHAIENIPFYQNCSIKIENDPKLFLTQFPIMRKNDIRLNLESLILGTKEDLISYSSSGSSGIQGTVYMNKKEQSVIRAIQVLWWEWAGFYIGKPILQTGMTPKRGVLKTIKDLLFRTRYYVAFGLSNESIRKVIENQKNELNFHLGGYASSLYLLAKTASKSNIDIKFDGVISWGDKMFAHYRKCIEETFKTRVFDTYACNEGFMIAAQYDLEFYYIMSPHVYVEIIDENGNELPDGELGFVVVTRLDGFSMPLIRYYNGDLAIKVPLSEYPPNRKLNFPLLKKIVGRDTDIVRTKSGKFMIVHFFTGIFEFYPEIEQFRVIQKELSGIIVEYIPGSSFKMAVLKEIEIKILEFLKEDFNIVFNNVEYIPPTKSGKPQIIQSYLNQN